MTFDLTAERGLKHIFFLSHKPLLFICTSLFTGCGISVWNMCETALANMNMYGVFSLALCGAVCLQINIKHKAYIRTYLEAYTSTLI